uniref:Uncharacterized protein n=1 Tax=viral metagenome TaxID=1070528 RepID=A0A6M3IQN2_9ZZZZ
MTKNTLHDMIVELAKARKVRDEWSEAVTDAQVGLNHSDAYLHFVAMDKVYAAAKAKAEEMRVEVAAAACKAYDGENKRPHAAIGVGDYDTMEYSDGDAVAWAIEKDFPQLLSLKKAQFKAMAKAAKPAFVIFGKEVRASVSGDLSEYLEGGSDE